MKGFLKSLLPVALIVVAVLSACDKKEDGTPPFVKIIGAADTTVFLNAPYSDPGAVAKDDYDDEVSYTTSGIVNTDSIGVYQITYTAADNSGNTSSATRPVRVVNQGDYFTGD